MSSDTNYKGVWHLSDNAANTTVADSTAANNGANHANTSTKSGTGKVARDLSYNGSDYTDLGSNVGNYGTANSFTIEAWINPALDSQNEAIYGNGFALAGYHIRMTTGNRLRMIVFSDGSNYAGRDSSMLAAGWHHVVGIWKGSGVPDVYVDGALDNAATITGGTVGSISTTAHAWIGATPESNYRSYFNGPIDEVRSSNSARSADWIKTEYNNQSSPETFYSVSAENNSVASPSDFAMARLDPHNRTGTGGVDLLSNNFNWSLPLMSLPGRGGLDLGLGLSYNSLVWTKSGNYIDWDLDQGSVAPGFRLSFPTIEGPYWNNQANANFYLLVSPSGGRVELRQASSGTTTYETKDSSYLQLTDNLNGTMTLRPTDGTQMNYISSGGGWRCSQIKDRNGNYITITYKSWGEIDQITDTLGRVLTFNYDGNDNIQSITQPWANNVTHQWATFGWGTATIGNNFPGLNNLGPNSTSIPVLTQVGLPDGSLYEFNYNSAGQVNTISRSPYNDPHHSYTVYDYSSSPWSDAPRVTQTRTWATNWSDQQGVPHEVATQFTHDTDGGCRMTMPDGTVYKEFYGGTGGSPVWQAGLTIESRNYATIADANSNVWQKKTTTTYTQDNTSVGYLKNPRVTETNIYDASGNRKRTTIDYSNATYAQYGLPYFVTEFAADAATEIRRTYTDYNLSQSYLDRRIIGLVSAVLLTDANGYQAKTTYAYDANTLNSNATTATQHDQTYGTSLTVRGNVTSVSRWDVTDINNSSKALTSTVTYNSAGSVLSSTDPAGHTNSVSYSDSFSDGNNSRGTFAYPTTVTDADGFSSIVQYRYEYGAKTQVQTPLPNVTTNQPGPVQTFEYDDALRIKRVTSQTTGAYTRYDYGADYVQTFSTVNNVADEAYTFQLFNGNGQVFIAGGIHPGSTGGYRAQTTYYDVMGRVMKQSNPTEINGSWSPAGDDAAGWVFPNPTEYDWKGRVLKAYNQDGTYKEASYSGCGCAGGEVVTLTDEVGRRQRVYSDVLGRQWKTEVLNWDGSVYATTTSTLNARDQATLVRQFAGTDQSTTYQDTTTNFDGYGRLQTKHVPEQRDSNNNPTYTTYAYNNDDTIQSVTDARGASATYSYNGRRLVTDINYFAPSGVATAPNVHFSFDSAGNRTFLIDGAGSQAYAYDQVSRLTSETRTFTGVGSFALSYDYNLAGELKRITDASNSTINYSYDSSGRVNGLTGPDNLVGGVAVYASSFAYRAWGGLKTMTDGSSHTSSLTYNSRLQPTQYDLSNNLVHQNYDYFADGRISFVHNPTDVNFDRVAIYDHVGRLTAAGAGGAARGDGGDVSYSESFAYDAFSNLNGRHSYQWNDYFEASDSASYTNNRRNGWGYDADGRNASIDTRSYSFDASGMIRSMTAQQVSPGGNHITVTQNADYDGDGAKIKELISGGSPVYYLRSSVLGGAIVEELTSTGQKNVGYVYSPSGNEIATQIGNVVTWKYRTPAGTSEYTINSANATSRTEFDPLGADVSTTAPINPPTNEGQGDIGAGHVGGIMDSRWADFFNLSSGCSKAGVSASCSDAMAALNSLGANGIHRVPTVDDNSAKSGIGDVDPTQPIIDLEPDFADWLAQRGHYGIPENLFELNWEYWQDLQQPVKLPAGLSAREYLMRRLAFGDADTVLLKDKKCRDFFAKAGKLSELRSLLRKLGENAQYDPKPTSIAGTTGKGADAVIRLRPPFFATDDTGYGRLAGYTWSQARNRYEEVYTSLAPRQYRALTILHEFAHSLSLIPDDRGRVDPTGEQSLKNDATINEKCGKGLGKLPEN